jgi:hypothetical protein
LDSLNFVLVHRCGDCGENFVGEVGVIHCAGDDERADEAGVGGEGFLAAKAGGVAVDAAGEIVEEGTEFVGEGAADLGALTGDLGSDCGHGAAAAGGVAMFWSEVGGGERFDGVAGGLIDDVGPVLPHPQDGTCACLGYEVFLRFKVAVEAAVSEAGCLHEFRDAYAVDAAFAKEPGGYVEDSLVIFGFLDAAYFHDGLCASAFCIPTLLQFPLRSYYMTLIMIGFGIDVRHIRLSGAGVLR